MNDELRAAVADLPQDSQYRPTAEKLLRNMEFAAELPDDEGLAWKSAACLLGVLEDAKRDPR